LLRYFTWYPKLATPLNETDCFLVGFNLRQVLTQKKLFFSFSCRAHK
jgi:hypothetical protein